MRAFGAGQDCTILVGLSSRRHQDEVIRTLFTAIYCAHDGSVIATFAP